MAHTAAAVDNHCIPAGSQHIVAISLELYSLLRVRLPHLSMKSCVTKDPRLAIALPTAAAGSPANTLITRPLRHNTADSSRNITAVNFGQRSCFIDIADIVIAPPHIVASPNLAACYLHNCLMLQQHCEDY